MKWLWLGVGAYVAFVAVLVVWATGRIDAASLTPIAYAEHPVNRAAPPPSAAVGGLLAQARAGDAGAQLRLGQAYAVGNGVPRDDVQAAGWYARSAGQGNVAAQARLGWAYHAGAGVPRDDVVAATWLLLASGQGDASAAARLAKVKRGLTPAQQDAAAHAAREWRARQRQ